MPLWNYLISINISYRVTMRSIVWLIIILLSIQCGGVGFFRFFFILDILLNTMRDVSTNRVNKINFFIINTIIKLRLEFKDKTQIKTNSFFVEFYVNLNNPRKIHWVSIIYMQLYGWDHMLMLLHFFLSVICLFLLFPFNNKQLSMLNNIKNFF